METEQELATLEDFAREYRRLDEQEKAAKKAKENLRGPFFALMTQEIRQNQKLETEIIDVEQSEIERFNNDPREYCLFYYPTYTVENMTFDGKVWRIVLKQNPELLPVDLEVDGFKLGRSISLVGAEFKAEEFYHWVDHHPEFTLEEKEALLATVTEVEPEPEWEFNEQVARDLIAEHPEVMPIFQRFSYAGKPQVKFLPVTKAKTEEENDERE